MAWSSCRGFPAAPWKTWSSCSSSSPSLSRCVNQRVYSCRCLYLCVHFKAHTFTHQSLSLSLSLPLSLSLFPSPSPSLPLYFYLFSYGVHDCRTDTTTPTMRWTLCRQDSKILSRSWIRYMHVCLRVLACLTGALVLGIWAMHACIILCLHVLACISSLANASYLHVQHMRRHIY